MSGPRRAYDLIRAYVNHGFDQFSDSDEEKAHRELREAIESPLPRPGATVSKPEVEAEPSLTVEQARSLFGLPSNATSKQISEAYDALKGTVDLSKFQEGSEAWQRARMLARRLDVARNLLIENMDPTVRRFEKLDIE